MGEESANAVHSVHVLLVEDDRSSAMVVEQHLRAMGSVQCMLETVRTLEQALERLSQERFDLIIADLHLPDSPADQTIGRLVERSELPIIALTIDESAELRDRALKSGAYDYLTKGQLGAGALERPVRLAALQAFTFRSLRESEARMKASEERFRKLTELSSDFYWEQDAEARITFLSRWLGQKSGLNPHAYLGRKRWDQPALNLTEADWQRHRAQLDRHEPFRDFEMQRPTADGSIWLSISGEPVFDASGRFTGYRGVGRDITERKRAEEELGRFRFAMDNSADMIVLVDRPSMRFVDVNTTLCRLTGYTRDEVLAMWPWDILPVTRAELEAAYDRLIADPAEPSGMRSHYRCKDGSLLPFESKRHVVRSAQGYMIVAISRDIRERIAADQALRDSEARFRSLTALSSDWYWQQDSEFRFTELTGPGAQALANGEVAQYLGKTRWDTADLAPVEGDWAAHRAMLARREAFHDVVLRRRMSDGSDRYMAISGEPMYAADGSFAGYRGLAKNVTEKIRSEQALRDSEARFRSLIELSYDFYWETDTEHRLTRTTHPDKHRPASQPVIGKTRWDLPSVFPDEAGWTAHRAALAARQPFRDFEIGRIDPDGVERFLSVSGEPAFDESGRFVGYRGVGRDISERRREQRLVSLEHSIARLLADADSPAGAVLGVMRLICQSERWDCGRYFTVDESANLARFSQAWCAPKSPMQGFCDASAGLTYAPGEGLIGFAWKSGEPLWIDNASQDPRVKAKALAEQAAIHGSLVFALSFAGRTLGFLSFSSTTVRKPDERLLGTMRAIGSQVGQFLQRKEAEAALLRFRTALDSSADMVFLFDLDQGRLLDFNHTACAYLGYSRDELLSLHARDIRVGMTRDRLQEEMRHLMASAGRSNTVSTEYRRKDGTTFPVESRRSVLDTPRGRVLVVNSRDLTERKSAEKRRAAQARYQKKIARLGQAALTMRDASDLIGRAVDSALDALGGPGAAGVAYIERGTGAGEVVVRRVGGLPGASGQAPVASCPPDAPLAQVLAQSEPAVLGAPWGVGAPLPFDWAHKFASAALIPVPGDGGPRAVLCALSLEPSAFRPEETRFLGAAASLLSAALHRVDSETRLAYMAQFDGLTGLPNRALLSDRFTQMIVQARRRGTSLGVLFIDLDGFKLINDTQGHAAGDELLKEVARRLKGSVRPGDTVARISGDEFAVVLVDLTRPDDAALVAQKIIERLGAPVAIGGQEVFTSASVGISTYPADGADAETLLGAADAAMYRAKESGRNGFHFFTAEINQRTRARAQLGHELRRAIERREFGLAYQPKIDLANGNVCGAEALLRWRHPERGEVEPVEFIPVLEETGLIVQVGEWVLRQACEDVKTWREAGLPPTPVAVNLSARQFRQQDLDARLRGIVEAAGIDPQLIELEITESHLMHDPEHAVRVLRSLGAAGLRIAIDDFGTGYSSLAYLTRFPLTSLKIDRSFVADALHDEADATIVRTIVDMAHTLGFTVIAEGVESDQQAAFLRALGCEAAQGFLFAGPMPAAEFAVYLESERASTSARASTSPSRRRPLRRTS